MAATRKASRGRDDGAEQTGALGQLPCLQPLGLKVLWNKTGLRAAARTPSGTLSYSGCVCHPVSYSEWLAQEEGGNPCCFKWLHLLLLPFEASLLMFLPTDAQFIQVAALLNSKHVDSLHRHQGHQVSQRRENVFQTPNPKQ